MLSSYDRLLALINASNPNDVLFDNTNIQFSDPIADNGTGWNTTITVSAIPNSIYEGNVEMHYTRIDISQIGTGLWLFSDIEFTVENIADILNATKNTFLLPEDFGAMNIPSMRTGDIETVTLTTNPKSLGWIGDVDVKLIMGFPGIASRLHQLVHFILPANYINVN